MGVYLNPGTEGFQESIRSEIYVDKTELIAFTNRKIGTEQKYICVSRPRRFGKSMTAKMLAAYYGRGYDSTELFSDFAIRNSKDFKTHLNQYHVILLNMQEFLSRTHGTDKMIQLLQKSVLRDLLRTYPDIDYLDQDDLISVLQDIYSEYKIPFVFIIDEWDCIFREHKDHKDEQKLYLDFLRNFLKDKTYVALAYMTGILPIKKYGTHSALNMFDEFSMTNPKQFAAYTGFTEREVQSLCEKYQMDFDEIRRWYDGYCFEGNRHIYSPRSVISAMLSRCYDNYWNQTETFEALRDYLILNFDGLRDLVTRLLAGERKKINVGTFTNDMTNLNSADDVLTLLIHLGYLGYDFTSQEVFIPNSEVSTEFVNAIQSAGWDEVIQMLNISDTLLNARLSH